jgi:hypothetical protein
VKTQTPTQAVAELLRFTPPPGWTFVSYANAAGADPVLRFEKLADAVQIRIFGAPGSDYPTPRDFLAGPAARDGDSAPDGAGTVSVAGRKLSLYRRRYLLTVDDPHGPPETYIPSGTEIFCVLPLRDRRFAVIAYRRASPLPDIDRKGEKAWTAFLKTVRQVTK